MSNIIISFCIPTYNRCDLLSELIKSIIIQSKNRNDIEICISDNASIDNTSKMVEYWKENTTIPIIYKRNGENVGPDKNFLDAVSLASGKYCWFFGSDDKLNKDALNVIDFYMRDDIDIYLVDRGNCDFSMNVLFFQSWLSSSQSKIYNTYDSSQLNNYMADCLSLGGVFSYLSSIIFNREKWFEVNFEPKIIGTAYAHVYYLLSILNKGATIQYIKKPLVLCRGDNDYFAQEGIVKRILLDFRGYFFFAEKIFSDRDMIKISLLSILLKERPLVHTTITCAVYGDSEQMKELISYYDKLGVHKFKISLIVFFKPIYLLANKLKLAVLYKKIRKEIGWRNGCGS